MSATGKPRTLGTPEDVAKIADLKRSGLTQAQVAVELGVSKGLVHLRCVQWERQTGEKLPRLWGKPSNAEKAAKGATNLVRCPLCNTRDQRFDHKPGCLGDPRMIRCGRCGLWGDHECIGRAADYMSTGSSNLGDAIKSEI